MQTTSTTGTTSTTNTTGGQRTTGTIRKRRTIHTIRKRRTTSTAHDTTSTTSTAYDTTSTTSTAHDTTSTAHNTAIIPRLILHTVPLIRLLLHLTSIHTFEVHGDDEIANDARNDEERDLSVRQMEVAVFKKGGGDDRGEDDDRGAFGKAGGIGKKGKFGGLGKSGKGGKGGKSGKLGVLGGLGKSAQSNDSLADQSQSDQSQSPLVEEAPPPRPTDPSHATQKYSSRPHASNKSAFTTYKSIQRDKKIKRHQRNSKIQTTPLNYFKDEMKRNHNSHVHRVGDYANRAYYTYFSYHPSVRQSAWVFHNSHHGIHDGWRDDK